MTAEPAPPSPPTTGLRSVRRHNLSSVLALLVEQGAASRPSIAEITGLTRATVGDLVTELADLGLVERRQELAQGRTGRPAQLIAPSDGRVVALGLDLAVDHLRVVAVGLSGAVLHERVVSGDFSTMSAARSIDRLARTAGAVMRDVADEGRTAVVAAVGVPGLVDLAAGTVLVAPNLGWHDVALGSRLGDRLGLAVTVENEANLAAVAEVRAGVGAAHPSLLVISAGIGVGAGVIIDGALFRGAHGFGGELGHLVVDPRGHRCACGNRGCLETVVGEARVRARLGTADDDRPWPAPLLDALDEPGATGRRARRILSDMADALARAIEAAVNLVDPTAIVLGGTLGPLVPHLEPVIRARLADHVLGARWSDPAVLASTFGVDACARGAALLALDQIVSDPAGALRRSAHPHRPE